MGRGARALSFGALVVSLATQAAAQSPVAAGPCEYLPRLPWTLTEPFNSGGINAQGFDPQHLPSGDARWHFDIRTDVLSFDEIDGHDLEDFGLEEFSVLRTTARFEGLTGSADHPVRIGIQVPYLLVDVEGAAGDDSFSGLGDVVVGLSVGFTHLDGDGSTSRLTGSEKAANADQFVLDVPLAVSLPTGDEDEGLGFGNSTAFVGLRARWALGTKRKDDDAPGVGSSRWAHWTLAPGTSTPDAITVIAGYEKNFADDDHSGVRASLGYTRQWEHVLFELAVDGFFGSDDVGTGGAHHGHGDQWDARTSLRFRLPGSERSDATWYLFAGLRSRLTDEGLTDRLSPTFGVECYWGGRE